MTTLPQSARYDSEQRELLTFLQKRAGTFHPAVQWHEMISKQLGQRRGRHPRATARRLVNLQHAGLVERRDDESRPGYGLWGVPVSVASRDGMFAAE